MMLLAVDIGNTSIAAGLFREKDLAARWKLRSDPVTTCDEYSVVLQGLLGLGGFRAEKIRGCIIGSVVPQLTPVFQTLIRNLFGIRPLVVGPGLKTGMPILYENPGEVGADRIVASVAAYDEFRRAGIIVDFGTATTFDAVSKRGEYLGGAIAPGVRISADALYLKTAKLPRFDIRKPARVIGRTTVGSMQSGLYYGYIGLVANIIQEVRANLEGPVAVVATGGAAELFLREIPAIDEFRPNLVLDGLRILFERNRPGFSQEPENPEPDRSRPPKSVP
jgi:type III pantothenate kinase